MNGMGYCNEELAQHLVQRLIIENSRMLVLRCLHTRMECLVVLEINLTVVHMKYRHFRYKSSLKPHQIFAVFLIYLIYNMIICVQFGKRCIVYKFNVTKKIKHGKSIYFVYFFMAKICHTNIFYSLF